MTISLEKSGDHLFAVEPSGHVAYLFINDRLSEVVVSSFSPTEFLGVSSGYPEGVLIELGYKPIGKFNAGRNVDRWWVYWVKQTNEDHYVVVSRSGEPGFEGKFLELYYSSGKPRKDLEPYI